MDWIAASVKRLLGSIGPTGGDHRGVSPSDQADTAPGNGAAGSEGQEAESDMADAVWTQPVDGRLSADALIDLFEDEETAPEVEHPISLTPVGTERVAATAQGRKLERVSRAFTPSQPKRVRSDFAGRGRQLATIVGAIEDQRSHVVLFAHRGLGKTSLANVVGSEAKRSGYHVIRYACSAETDFSALFRSLVDKIPPDRIEGAGTTGRRGLPARLVPSEAIDFCSRISKGRILIIIDDLDAIRDATFHRSLVETMKGISDVGAPLTFLVLGVAHDLEAFFGEDGRIERNIVTVHLPHMTQRELSSIIDWGLDVSGLTIDPEVKKLAVMLSRGLPFVVSSLCLHAGCAAVRAERDEIGSEEFAYAMRRLVDQIDPRVIDAYRRVTRAESHTFMVDILFAAAAARMDEHGRFTIRDAAAIRLGDGRKAVPEAVIARVFDGLADEEGVLERHTSSLQEVSFGFRSELMRPYVVMRQSLRYGLFDPAGSDIG